MRLLTLIFLFFLSNNLLGQKSRLPEIEKFAVDLFLNRNYDQVVNQIEPMISSSISTDNLNRVVSYSKIELKDFAGGIRWINEKISSKNDLDNLYLGRAYQGIGNDSLAIIQFEILAPADLTNNLYINIHDIRYKQKRYKDAAIAALKVIEWKQKKNQAVGSGDYFKAAMDYYFVAAISTPKEDTLSRVSVVMKSDTLFAKAIAINDKWPPFYLNRARINNLIDFTGTKWLGVPHYEKFLETVAYLREEKSNTFKEDPKQLFEAYKYLGGYHLTVTKNELKVKDYFSKALEIKSDDKEVNEYFNSTGAAPKK
ncbi:MAG: hypothetical protein RL108_660 [Bacteroidota bacterium]|jgi:tetratricopeptide (TPR) repeat protein